MKQRDVPVQQPAREKIARRDRETPLVLALRSRFGGIDAFDPYTDGEALPEPDAGADVDRVTVDDAFDHRAHWAGERFGRQPLGRRPLIRAPIGCAHTKQQAAGKGPSPYPLERHW